MRRQMGGVHGALLRGLKRLLSLDAGLAALPGGEVPAMVVEEMETEPWASVTFAGWRHRIELRLEGDGQAVEAAVERAGALIERADLTLPGHLLAEIAVTGADSRWLDGGQMATCLTIEALTVGT